MRLLFHKLPLCLPVSLSLSSSIALSVSSSPLPTPFLDCFLLFCLDSLPMSLSTKEQVHHDVLSQARQQCYKARDAFYDCVEREANKKPTEVASVGLLYPSECKKLRSEFEKNCRQAWVKHFDRLYCAKKRGQRFLDENDTRRGPVTLPMKNLKEEKI